MSEVIIIIIITTTTTTTTTTNMMCIITITIIIIIVLSMLIMIIVIRQEHFRARGSSHIGVRGADFSRPVLHTMMSRGLFLAMVSGDLL